MPMLDIFTQDHSIRNALQGRGKPPPAQCPGTAHSSPTHHAQCRTRAPQSIACRCASRRRNLLFWRPRSCQKLVDIVVEAILDAGVDTASPRGPETVADPALSEANHPATIGIDAIAEVELLYLNLMLARDNGSNDVLVLADGGEGGIVLDP